jgi:hypothetical protein
VAPSDDGDLGVALDRRRFGQGSWSERPLYGSGAWQRYPGQVESGVAHGGRWRRRSDERPTAEREKLTVGSCVIDNSRIKTLLNENSSKIARS